jgi:adenylate cyclase
VTPAHKDQLKTRLAVFAFADVAEYSRHMSDDSLGTVRAWAQLREDVLLQNIDSFNGRAVSMAGDALLLEFSSAAAAVNWALQAQAKLRDSSLSRGLSLRIGINVDDVHDDGRTLQSDGVVVASRIQQLAAPGEVVATKLVADLVRDRIPAVFRDLGAPTLKNIDRPIRVFSVSASEAAAPLVRPHASWSSRPTLAVLPFEDPGGDAQQRYFAEGITEEIITGVSRSRSMFVVARSSTLQFADRSKSQKEIAAALGVKYLLTGLIQRSGDQLRLSTELVDVDHGKTVWAERYDGTVSDLFEFQDNIASSIVASLEPKVLGAETRRLGARPTESLDAYDCVLRGLSELYRVDESGYLNASELFVRAAELDSAYAQAHAYIAWSLIFVIAEGYSKNMKDDRQRAIDHATIAVDLDAEDAFNLAVRGHVLGLLEGRPYEAVDLLEDAVRLNENLPLAWALSATSYAYLGDGDEARERLLNVWRLTPYDPLNFFFWAASGLGEFVAGHYDEAISVLLRAHRIKPNFRAGLRLLAASLALDGQKERAQEIAAELLNLDPTFSISKFMAWYPLRKPETREKLVLGLSSAGLPN